MATLTTGIETVYKCMLFTPYQWPPLLYGQNSYSQRVALKVGDHCTYTNLVLSL